MTSTPTLSISGKSYSPGLNPLFIRYAAIATGILMATIPALALASVAVGAIGALICLVGVLATWLGFVMLPVGAITCFGGKTDDDKGAGCGMIVIGAGLAAISYNWGKSITAAAATSWATGLSWADTLWTNWFIGHNIWAMALVPLEIGSGVALVFLMLLGVAMLEVPLKGLVHAIRYQCAKCPYSGTPFFRCPGCRGVLRNLRPSVHGIFFARCGECDTRVPTMDTYGRLRLEKVCPTCSEDQGDVGFGTAPEVVIGLVGAPSAGKSQFLAGALHCLQVEVASRRGVQCRHESKVSQRWMDGAVTTLRQGLTLPKTTAVLPAAFTLGLWQGEEQLSRVYFYDVSGESWADPEKLKRLQFQSHLDAIFLLLDPFAEPEIVEHLAPSGRDIGTVNPAQIRALDILEHLVRSMEYQLRVSSHAAFDVSLVVVLSKADACHFRERVKEAGGPEPFLQARKSASLDQFLIMARKRFRDVTLQVASVTMSSGRVFNPTGCGEALERALEKNGAFTPRSDQDLMVKRAIRYGRHAANGLEGASAQRAFFAVLLSVSGLLIVLLSWQAGWLGFGVSLLIFATVCFMWKVARL